MAAGCSCAQADPLEQSESESESGFLLFVNALKQKSHVFSLTTLFLLHGLSLCGLCSLASFASVSSSKCRMHFHSPHSLYFMGYFMGCPFAPFATLRPLRPCPVAKVRISLVNQFLSASGLLHWLPLCALCYSASFASLPCSESHNQSH